MIVVVRLIGIAAPGDWEDCRENCIRKTALICILHVDYALLVREKFWQLDIWTLSDLGFVLG